MRGEFIDVGGRRLYYFAAGSRGSGEPVVLVHGFPTSSRIWHAVVRDFPEGHRLVVVDLPGFGRSEPGPDLADAVAHARALLSLLDELRIPRACLVGHGSGGAVVQRLAAMVPGRVSHLALIDTPAFGATPRRLAPILRAALPVARRLPPAILAGVVHGAVVKGFAIPDRSRLTLDTCLAPFTTPAGREALVAHLRALGSCDTAETSPRLATLGIPTAVVWGTDDPFYPATLGERLQRAIPQASLDLVPGARHFLPEDAPDRIIARVVELVSRGPAQRSL
jgi:pimeloyl-ACP methyl ester carboxylesterase